MSCFNIKHFSSRNPSASPQFHPSVCLIPHAPQHPTWAPLGNNGSFRYRSCAWQERCEELGHSSVAQHSQPVMKHTPWGERVHRKPGQRERDKTQEPSEVWGGGGGRECEMVIYVRWVWLIGGELKIESPFFTRRNPFLWRKHVSIMYKKHTCPSCHTISPLKINW